jgi:hypothetical protein
LIKKFLANPGDSLIVHSFDNFYMNRYGNYYQWVYVNPAKPYAHPIGLTYKLGFLSNVQCKWNYTIKLFAREHTGNKDSTLMQAPSFRVNGKTRNSIRYSSNNTYQKVFNTGTTLTDSVPKTALFLVLYNNADNPLQPTDSLRKWPANFYMYSFDTTGNKIDSFFVLETNKLYRTNTPYYNVFSVINNIKIGKFIPPYAKSSPKNFKYDYISDVTDYAPLFYDTFELRIQCIGYFYWFTATINFIFIEGTPARNVLKVVKFYSYGFQNKQPNNSIENCLTLKKHSTNATDQSVKANILITDCEMKSSKNCPELCAKYFILKHYNNTIANKLTWKDDCGKNAIINHQETWIYDKSNQCQGKAVPLYKHVLNANLGSNNTIDLDTVPSTANSDAAYYIKVQPMHSKTYNDELDLGVKDILSSGNNFWYNCTNPICTNTQIKLHNCGQNTIQPYEGMGSLSIIILHSPTVRLLCNFSINFGTFTALHFISKLALHSNENNTKLASLEVYLISANKNIVISYGNAFKKAKPFNTPNKEFMQNCFEPTYARNFV